MADAERRTTCPNCQGKLEYSASYEGQTMACPHGCGVNVLLTSAPLVSEQLKTNCPNCRGEVAYPAVSEGQKSPCPHGCGAKVLLKSVAGVLAVDAEPNATQQTWQPYDDLQPVEKEESSEWKLGIGVFALVIIVFVAKDLFFSEKVPVGVGNSVPLDSGSPSFNTEPSSTEINKSERLELLKLQLMNRSVETVVGIMGKPDRVLNGGSDLFYKINEVDSVTGAEYKHIQIFISDNGTGTCERIAIGVTDMFY